MYDSRRIANYFIDKSFKTGVSLTPMQLLKLVYISHGWYLGMNERPLISDAVQAWRYGPVIPKLYHEIKHYRKSPITSRIDLNHDLEISPNETEVSREDSLFLDSVWNHYHAFSGLQLSTITHQEGSPWDQIYNGDFNTIIPEDVIRNHYKNRIDAQSAV